MRFEYRRDILALNEMVEQLTGIFPISTLLTFLICTIYVSETHVLFDLTTFIHLKFDNIVLS